MKKTVYCLLALMLLLAAVGCGAKPSGAPDTSGGEAISPPVEDQAALPVASADQMAPVEDVEDPGLTPVYGGALRDGVYSVAVDSSSSMFNVTACELTVEGGEMTAVMHMGGTGYRYVFPGTGEEAAQAEESTWIPYTEEDGGVHSFTIPIEALDMGVDCAAFSKKKELWYDRTLVFRSDSLPAEAFQEESFPTAKTLGLRDGNYTVDVWLEGGSGRASVESPAVLRVENGEAYAVVVWGSSNYDYMRIGEERFLPLEGGGNSTFSIPVAAFDRRLTVYADTTAMSTPHEIEYTLRFDSASLEEAP